MDRPERDTRDDDKRRRRNFRITQDTLRYYERRMIPPAIRTSGVYGITGGNRSTGQSAAVYEKRACRRGDNDRICKEIRKETPLIPVR